MNRFLRTRALAGLTLALIATAAVAQVSVRYDHPENFTETREVKAFAPFRADPGYLDVLKAYIEKRAARVLQPGQSLEVTITDIDRAGSYLPTAGSAQPVRIVESVYPPRINLRFRLLDGQGQVIEQGERKLIGLGFLYDHTGGASDTDPLQYEKRLINRWLAKGPGKL